MTSVDPPPQILQEGPNQPGPPPALAPAAFPYAVVERGVTTIEQLLAELVRLDRHPGVRYPVLVEFPRCKHTVIFAVPRLQLTGTTYAERMVALWSRGCPVCQSVPPAEPDEDPFDAGALAGMDAVMARVLSGNSACG